MILKFFTVKGINRFFKESNMKIKLVLSALFLFLAVSAFAQDPAGGLAKFLLLGGNEGDYRIIDEAQIQQKQIEWGMMAQTQDRELYEKALIEAKAAFDDLYGSCTDGRNLNSCSGFRKLVQIHINTSGGAPKDEKALIHAADLQTAVQNYFEKRTTFLQKIAAVAVTQDVFSGIAKGGEGNQERQYELGAFNLKAFAKVYQDAVAELDQQARELTYRVDLNLTVFVTEPGQGLTPPDAMFTPDQLAENIRVLQQALALTPEEEEAIELLSINLGRQLLSFFNANNKKLYWYNDEQTKNGKDFVESISNKFRTLQWVRGGLCMKLGVPAIDIAEPKKFNLNYLNRGLSDEDFRFAQATEWDEGNIYSILQRFDEFFLSVRSQAGEFNEAGGLMGFVNRVNSTLTWHNEAKAALSMMRLLRENMTDELDIARNLVLGCNKVKERYKQKYGSFRDEFYNGYIKPILRGTVIGTSGDPTMLAFQEAGPVIFGKVRAKTDYDMFLAEHPGADELDALLDDLNLD